MANNFVSSERNRQKLVDNDNFVYVFSKRTLDGVNGIWMCEKRGKCRGRVWTDGITSNVVRVVTPHNHAAQAARPEVVRVIQEIKQRAVNAQHPQQIIAQSVATVHANVAAQMPSREALKRTIRRVRQADGTPALPADLEHLIIPQEYQEIAINGVVEQFLRYDSQRTLLPGRILIFSTAQNLKILAQAQEWFADGTFSVAPNLFLQVYTIHVVLMNSVVPVVYALLPNKTRVTYQFLLQEIKTLQQGLQPSCLITDFEQAAIAAFQIEFPQIEITGCFHLTQNVWRKVQLEGLQVNYQQDHDFATWIRMIPAIALCPGADVEDAFDELAADPQFPPAAQPIINYFEDTYVGRAGRRGHRRPPSYAPALWNVYDRTRNGMQRTNNDVEGWHRGFQTTCGSLFPNIYRFIDALKRQQGLHNFDIAQFAAGQQQAPRNKRYAEIDGW